MQTLTGGKYTELVFDREFSVQAGEGGANPRREALQLDADEKLERADYALINSGTAAELKAEFRVLLAQITK